MACGKASKNSSKCSANKVKKSNDENYWVGLNASKLFTVVCKGPDSYPLVALKPILTLLNLSCPIASSDLGADDLEADLIMSNLRLLEIQKKIEQLSTVGLDATTLDDEAFNMEAAIDRCILRLIASCCNGDKLVRATELAGMLSLEKSIKGAIKLVTAFKLPILAERFSAMLEERLLNESKGVESVPHNGTITNNVSFLHGSPASKNKIVMEPAVMMSSPAHPPKDTSSGSTKLAINHDRSSLLTKVSNNMENKTADQG